MKLPSNSMFALLLVVAVFAGAAQALLSRAGPSAPSVPGSADLRQAMVFVDGDRAFVSAMLGTRKGDRMYVWDASTGGMLAEGTLAAHGGYQLLRRVGPLTWAVHPEEGLQLLDLRTASVVVSQQTLVEVIPDLAEGFELRLDTVSDYTAPMPGVQVLLRDGRLRYIDMGALNEAPVLAIEAPTTTPWRPGYFCDPGGKPSCERRECLSWWGQEGTTAMVLGSAKRFGDRGDTVSRPLEGATPLLRPGLVGLLETECAFEAAGHVLVAHDSAALEPKETLFSLLDDHGRVLWTVPLAKLTTRPGSEAVGAQWVNKRILLLLSDNKHHLDLVQLQLDGTITLTAELF